MTHREFDSWLLWACRAIRAVGDKWQAIATIQGGVLVFASDSAKVIREVWFGILGGLSTDEAKQASVDLMRSGRILAFDRLPGQILQIALASRKDDGPEHLGGVADEGGPYITAAEFKAKVMERVGAGDVYWQALLNRIEQREKRERVQGRRTYE